MIEIANGDNTLEVNGGLACYIVESPSQAMLSCFGVPTFFTSSVSALKTAIGGDWVDIQVSIDQTAHLKLDKVTSINNGTYTMIDSSTFKAFAP